MKFHDENDGDFNRITAYDEKSITVSSAVHRESLVVLRNHIIPGWPVTSMEEMSLESIQPILEQSPQIVIFGAGLRASFEMGEWTKAFADASIGFEVMSTPAACRTFNIVAGEGRNVAAALVIERAADPASGND